MKRRLIAGCINWHPDLDGWWNTHLDASSRGLYDGPRRRLVPPDVVADIRWTSFEDGSFDEVRLHDVLEHLGAPEALDALREIHRVLRPFGVLDVQVPNVDHAARSYAAGDIGLASLLQLFYGQRLQNHEETDYHRFGWTPRSLAGVLAHDGGFVPGQDLGSGTAVVRYRAVRR